MPDLKPLKTLGTAIDKDKPIYPFNSDIIQAEIRRLYDSPISAYIDQPEMTFCTKVVNGIDTQFFQAVQKAGVTVDKDELVKALKYDRGQYEKGFADGVNYCRQIITESDTISEQAAAYNDLLNCLRLHSTRSCNDGGNRCMFIDARERGYRSCSTELAEKAADAIEELLKEVDDLRRNQKWISVHERLPKEENKEKFVYVTYIMHDELCVNIDRFIDGDFELCPNVVAWMSLPEPYKG